MNDWDELDAILQKYDYTFINDNGVVFTRVAPGFMFVDSPWPGRYIIDEISLVYLCNDASDFFDRLEIKNANELYKVNQEILLKLFHAGEVIVACKTDEGEILEFLKSEGKLIANKEDSDLIHIVKPDLSTPEEFIEYTKQYFLKLKDEPIRKN